MKKALLGLVLLVCASALFADTGDARSVLNTFIATFAKDNPAWKTDIVAITDPTNVPPGRQLGYSTVLGYYTFLPKTWEQLTETERQIVTADPRLKPFLVSLRNYNNYPTLTATDTPKPAFAVYPVEGMNPQMPGAANNGSAPTVNYNYYYGPAQGQAAYPNGYYAPASVYTNPAGYYYTPQQLSPGPSLVQPVTVMQQPRPEVSSLKVSPEEMLLDRPLKVYMQK